MAPVLLGALLEPEPLAAIRRECTPPSRHAAWLALAAACYSPFRERCAELAEACGWRPAA